MDRAHAASRGPSGAPPAEASHTFAAEAAAYRHLDPETGLPRAAALRSALAAASCAPRGTPVVVIVTVDVDLDATARRTGTQSALQLHRAVGAALRGPVSAPADPWDPLAPVRAVVRGTGRYLVTLSGAAGGPAGAAATDAVRQAVELALRGAARQLGIEAPPYAFSARSGPAAPELLDDRPARGAVDEGGVELLHEPVVSIRSGRVRALHLRTDAVRPRHRLTVTELEGLLPDAARAAAMWPSGVRTALHTLWVDVTADALTSTTLHRIAGAWPRAAVPALGLRVRAEPALDEPDVARAVQLLGSGGARLAMSGLSDGTPDPARVSPGVHELVLDPGLTADAATGAASAQAVPGAVVALGAWLSLLTTADGVDDRHRLRTAGRLGAWYAEGRVFGPPRPLTSAPPLVVRAGAVPTQHGPGDHAPAADGHEAEQPAAWGAVEVEPELREVLRGWLDEGVTPAHVRIRLNALRRYGRWTLADASTALTHAARP